MVRLFIVANLLVAFSAFSTLAQELEKDTIETSAGDLEITFIGHGTLMFTFGGKVIQIDPWSKLADYSKMPKADIILLTHEHHDHLDLKALEIVRTGKSLLILTETCATRVKDGIVMKNGDIKTVGGLIIEAVPAYNLVHMRSEGVPFHPKGIGNGYVITFGDKKVYVAGDTENTPEMKGLTGIDIAFLPMNLPYTMTPQEAAECARAFAPGVVVPFHYAGSDLAAFEGALDGAVDVRLLEFYPGGLPW